MRTVSLRRQETEGYEVFPGLSMDSLLLVFKKRAVQVRVSGAVDE